MTLLDDQLWDTIAVLQAHIADLVEAGDALAVEAEAAGAWLSPARHVELQACVRSWQRLVATDEEEAAK